jgi:hypothetical protein
VPMGGHWLGPWALLSADTAPLAFQEEGRDMPTILVEDLRKIYRLVAAVDGLSFSAEAVDTSNVQRPRRDLPVEFEPPQP